MAKETKKTSKKTEVKKDATIGAKLQYIQANLKAPKSQYNNFGKYNYRNCEDILEALKPLLDETKTILTISDEIILVGNRYYIRATAQLTNTLSIKPDFETIKVSAYAREPDGRKGMDSAQVTGSTSSYARKYALNGLFAIDDARDPDTQDNSVNNTQPTEQKTKSKPKPESNVAPAESKVLNLIIEKLAPTVKSGFIIDIKKLKQAVVDKFESLPTQGKSAEVILKYLVDDLGIDAITTENDFLAGLEK